jgi:hypothetical protein
MEGLSRPQIEKVSVSAGSREKLMLAQGNPAPNRSGRQEMIENLINTYF